VLASYSRHKTQEGKKRDSGTGSGRGELSWLDPGTEGAEGVVGSQGSLKTKPPLPHTPPSPRSFPWLVIAITWAWKPQWRLASTLPTWCAESRPVFFQTGRCARIVVEENTFISALPRHIPLAELCQYLYDLATRSEYVMQEKKATWFCCQRTTGCSDLTPRQH